MGNFELCSSSPGRSKLSRLFPSRYEKEFENVQDVVELQRNLNNAFAYDLVPSPSVITAALRAARRVNDYPTAVRIFEGMYSCFTFYEIRIEETALEDLGVSNHSQNVRARLVPCQVEVEPE